MGKTKQIMQDSFKILNSLTPDNGKFFFDLMSYLRYKGPLKNELALELKINEIANDLKNADLAGISAEDFFGNQPKATAEEILKALPNDKLRNILRTHLLLLLAGLGVLAALNSNAHEIKGIDHYYVSLLGMFITIVSFLIFIGFTTLVFSHAAFNPKWRKRRPYVIWVASMIFYATPMLVLKLLNLKLWCYDLPTEVHDLLIPISFLLLILYCIKQFPIVEMFKTRNRF
jgi:hypothetical protein